MNQFPAAGEGSGGASGTDVTDTTTPTGTTTPTDTTLPTDTTGYTDSAGGTGGAGDGAAQAWAALGGDLALLARATRTRRTGPAAPLPSVLPVRELATGTVTACSLAAAEFSCVRERSTFLPPVHVDDGAVAAAFHSERHLRIDGRAPDLFAPLSRFWRTADGWVRTHANYPHHRARLLVELGLDAAATEPSEALVAKVAAALAERAATEVEERVYAAGGLAVAVRTPGAWQEHPQHAAVDSAPLVSTVRLDGAGPLPLDGRPGPGGLQGLRVLDLTRVLAGPIATRTLGLLGADVLRIEPPRYPELPDTYADTGFGKRSTVLDLASRSGQAAFEELLASAHLVVTGYRPGALDRFGLAPESLADRRPGLVVGQLCAWGNTGPWQRRRGFDSLVQAASGIARVESADGDTPGALPAQALDHGSGYLLAGALLRALTEQRTGTGGSRIVRLALARTAEWLLHELPHDPDGTPGADGTGAPGDGAPPFDPGPWLSEADSALGRLRYVRSPVGFGEHSPRTWTRTPDEPGADASTWL
ncbi:CoA transferase [Streptomyces boncukensis]|uniref:CoA-transferase n=1 Tax=Streptomyces boncukensis TaxID=2711219 RepID=A0A6G4X4C4_9ACTN|nr:CoA transferase [Streptomyces boncukensis]NGO71521.1 hypothetical protein [Streptomyces boncukensis]